MQRRRSDLQETEQLVLAMPVPRELGRAVSASVQDEQSLWCGLPLPTCPLVLLRRGFVWRLHNIWQMQRRRSGLPGEQALPPMPVPRELGHAVSASVHDEASLHAYRHTGSPFDRDVKLSQLVGIYAPCQSAPMKLHPPTPPIPAHLRT